jgi:hypothetical protein
MDIQKTDADDREVISASLMREILDCLFAAKPEFAILVAQLFRANDRILSTDEIPLILASLETLGVDDAWEILALFGSFRHIDMPIIPNIRLDLNAISKSDCKKFYRFDQDELQKIIPLLPFPEYIVTPERDKAHLIEAFCIVIRRMSSRGTMSTYCRDFGRSQGSLCRIMIYMCHLLLGRVGSSVFFYPVTLDQMNQYRDAFICRGAPECLNIALVLDNKKQYTCKPTHNQKSQYNRYKKGHGPKHQTLDAPDGLIIHQYAGDGRPGDSFIARESRLPDFWRAHPILHVFRILTDSAYPNNTVFVGLYKRRRRELVLPFHRRLFNRTLAPVRTVGVEDDYSLIVANWPFLDNKKSMKMEKSPVIAYWTLGVWLTNLLTCAHGRNQVSNYFDCMPPPLEEFMHVTLEN